MNPIDSIAFWWCATVCIVLPFLALWAFWHLSHKGKVAFLVCVAAFVLFCRSQLPAQLSGGVIVSSSWQKAPAWHPFIASWWWWNGAWYPIYSWFYY